MWRKRIELRRRWRRVGFRREGRWEENVKPVEDGEVLEEARVVFVKDLWARGRRGVLLWKLEGRKAGLLAIGKRSAPRAAVVEMAVRNIL